MHRSKFIIIQIKGMQYQKLYKYYYTPEVTLWAYSVMGPHSLVFHFIHMFVIHMPQRPQETYQSKLCTI